MSIKGNELTVFARTEGFRSPMRVRVGDEVRELGPGSGCVFTLPPQAPSVHP